MRAPWAFACLLFSGSLIAQPSPGKVSFTGEGCSDWIGRSMMVFHDSTATMTVEDVVSSNAFQSSDRSILNLGVSDAAHWLRFDVANMAREGMPWIMVQYPEIEALDIHLSRNGVFERIVAAGQTRPLDPSVQSTPIYGFELPVVPGEHATVLIRARSAKQLQLPIAICSEASFQSYSTTRNFWIGGFIGIMLVMALYNLFVYLSIRDSSYLLYVVYIVLVCLTQVSLLGLLGYHLQGWGVWIVPNASLILTCLTAIAAGVFMQRFLRVDRYLRTYGKVTMVFNGLLVVGVAIALSGHASIGYQMGQGVAGTYAFYQVFVAIVIRRRGSRSAIFFLLAWTVFLFGVVVFVLKDKNVLPYNAFTNYTMPVGSVIEVVLLSFGLADRINILRREKERSQADALRVSQENERIIRDQNTVLEQKVTERTHELRQANTDLKQAQSQLVNSEKMASLGQLTAGIAHEINNPVNFISSNIPPLRRNLGEMVEVLQRYRSLGSTIDTPEIKALRLEEEAMGIDDSIAETSDMLASIENGASRTAEIVRGLRNFSRLDESDLKAADVNEGLRNTIAVLSPQVRQRVRIEQELGDLPVVECYPGKLNQVFMNLLTNAAQAVTTKFPEGGGEVRVSTRMDGDRITVTITDNGPGFTPEVKARMFEPFFTTKGVGEGTGLGLSIAYGIIEKHNGTIEADSGPGMGATFRIVLPIVQQQNAKRA